MPPLGSNITRDAFEAIPAVIRVHNLFAAQKIDPEPPNDALCQMAEDGANEKVESRKSSLNQNSSESTDKPEENNESGGLGVYFVSIVYH